ncbi:hypothetical protein PAP_06230 [Palaeococcus pacificus DY20341]|uniref:THIF-type NAD/FAD binding fold domain-containing protein n=1 Tax=Palaeococcus pacificus DY20341 TaxID=1343739 RepID=A0A075LTI8_9EURY|nr:ThiF family adenylyltransferase [Palaeococcus pacificus]AIF69644.1 hypothetical protein PAP_06230 [Palaeococcus pacificus DY20341]
MLSKRELERYSREIEILSVEGQEKLKNSKVAVVGIGGLGSPVAYYLAAAGIGELLLIDAQKPELNNLDRQILHWEEDLNKNPKVISAKWKLERFNSDIKIETFIGKLTRKNIDEVLREVDVVVDCVDNFETRYILDEYTTEKNIPLVHAAISGFYGQVTTIIPGETECLKDMFPDPPQGRKEKSPIFGPIAGIIGTIEVAEVVKLITKCGELLTNKLLIVDLACDSFEIIDLKD